VRPTLILNGDSSLPGSQSQVIASAQQQGMPPVAAASGSAAPVATPAPAPKFRQNIIIVKNINVLTKLQQVKPSSGAGASHSSASEPAASQSAAANSAESVAASAPSASEAAAASQSRFGQVFSEEGQTEEGQENAEENTESF